MKGDLARCFASFVDLSIPEEVAAVQKITLEFEKKGGHSEEAKKILSSDVGKMTDSSIHIVPVMVSMNISAASSEAELVEVSLQHSKVPS